MAKTKATAKTMRDQTVDELKAKEKELAQQLFALRLNKSTGQLESPARVRAVRRERARVLTVLGERTT
jgi:large subunit ribosomal protein L29